MMEAMVVSALDSPLPPSATACATTRSSLSAKVSGVRDLIDVYEVLASRCDYPLHFGLTEAGMGMKGIVASAAGWRRCCCRESAIPFGFRCADSGWRPHGRGFDRAADPAIPFNPEFYAPGNRMSGLRAHHEHFFSGTCTANPELPSRHYAAMA